MKLISLRLCITILFFIIGQQGLMRNYQIYVGTVEEVDNETPPSENFVGSRIDVGQKIYADDKKSDTIYVEYENGYARFSLSSTQK